MKNFEGGENEFKGFVLPSNKTVPAQDMHGNEIQPQADFKVGDEVMINYGPSGKVGPAIIQGQLYIEHEDGYKFHGYDVRFPRNDKGDLMSIAYLPGEMLETV